MSKEEDIVMKNVFDLLKGDALKYFGIDKEIIAPARTEKNYIEVTTKFDDTMYLFSDGTCGHIEFQSTYSKENIYRFMVSDAIFIQKEQKPVKTLIIYTADIKSAQTKLDMGSITYDVEAFYMVKFDGDQIYAQMKEKVEAHKPLNKQDIMNIVLLPTMSSSVSKEIRIRESLGLSRKIENKNIQGQIQSMLFLFAQKFVDDQCKLEDLREEFKMSVLGDMIFRDGILEGRMEGILEARIEIAKKMFGKFTAEQISETTELSLEEVERLQETFLSSKIYS